MQSSRSSWIGIFAAVTVVHVGLIFWLIFYFNPVFIASHDDGVVYPSFTSGEVSSRLASLPDPEPQSAPQALSQPQPELTPSAASRPQPEPVSEPEPVQPPQQEPDPLLQSAYQQEQGPRPDPKSAAEPSPQSVPLSSFPPSPVPETASKPASDSASNAAPINATAAKTISANPAPSPTKGETVIMVTQLDYADGPPKPVYPSRAKQAGQEGKVILRVTINQHGELESLQVRQSSGFDALDDAAKQAVQRVRFRPYTADGIPMRAMADIPFDFVLNP